MFFRKKNETGPKLSDVVKKVSDTGYIFWNINDDLGDAAEQIMRSSLEVKMAYGYARRTAVAALYMQGLVNRDVFDHVSGIFTALQQQTGHTVEFQEMAYAESTKFMQGYHHLIGGLFARKLIQVAREYEVRSERLSDPELFKAVMDTIYAEQEEARRGGSGPDAAFSTPQNHHTFISKERIRELIAELKKISERQTEKTVTMWIQPLDENWSYELHFSNEERDLTYELLAELNALMKFRISTPVFPYRPK